MAKKILIVEDESIIALDIKHALELKDFDIVGITTNGIDSLRLIEENKPDIVLMDIMLEGDMDGITTAEEIKIRHDIPIIYLTAHSDENTLNRAKATEPYGYILKPVNETEMYSSIVTALYKHELQMKLKESEIRYRNLFENAQNGVIILQPLQDGADFTLIDINRAAERIDRINREEFIGKSITRMFAGIRESGLFDVIQRVYRTGEPEHHPASWYCDERVSGWRESSAYTLPTNEIILIYEDITEKKETEDALRQSEEKFRAFTESTPCAIFIIQGDRFQYVNPAFTTMSGYRIDDLKDKNFLDIIHPDFRELVQQIGKARMEGNTAPARYGFKVITRSGDERWIDYSATIIEYEGTPAVLGSAFDITDQKHTEDQLRLSEEKFFRAFHSSPALTTINTYRDGEFIDVNETACRMSGYRREEIIGKTIFDLNLFKDIDNFNQYIDMLQREGRVREFDLKFRTKSGKTRIGRVSAEIIRIGDVKHVITSMIDITEKQTT